MGDALSLPFLRAWTAASGGRRRARRHGGFSGWLWCARALQPSGGRCAECGGRCGGRFRTDRDAGGLAAAGGDGRLPDGVAEKEGHKDLADQGGHAAVGGVDDVGAEIGGHVHFAGEDECEDDGAEKAARSLGRDVSLKRNLF